MEADRVGSRHVFDASAAAPPLGQNLLSFAPNSLILIGFP